MNSTSTRLDPIVIFGIGGVEPLGITVSQLNVLMQLSSRVMSTDCNTLMQYENRLRYQ